MDRQAANSGLHSNSPVKIVSGVIQVAPEETIVADVNGLGSGVW